MHELVYAHVPLVGRVPEATNEVRLRQNHQPVQTSGADHPEYVVILSVAEVELAVEASRIDQDLLYLIPFPVGKPEDRNDGADRRQHLGGRVQTHLDAGDSFLAQEYLQFPSKPRLVARVKRPKEQHITLENGFPLWRKRLSQQRPPTASARGLPGVDPTRRRQG